MISAFVGIFMALRGFGAWALVAQEMTNSLIDTLVLFFTTRLKISFRFSGQRLKSLFAFGSRNFLSSMLTVIYDQLTPLIVGLRFTTEDLAFYTKGKSFPELINSTLSDTMATVLFPVMAQVQDSTDHIRGITRRYIKTASYVIFPVMLGMFAVSDVFLTLLLTDKRLSSAVYIRIFCVSYMFNLVNVGNIQAIRALGRSDIVLKLEVLKKSIYLAVLCAFLFLSDRPQLLAVSSVVCTLIAVALNAFPNRKLIGYRFRWQLADILPNLLLSGVMCLIVVLLGRLPLAPLPLLLVQVVSGGAVYVLASAVTRNESFFYLLDFLRHSLKRG